MLHRRPSGLLFIAKDRAINPDGSVLFESDWEDVSGNEVADEGEASIINVYLREQANPTKYLMLANDVIGDTDTMASVTESVATGTNGYNRQQVLAADWGAPALDAGDHMTTPAAKTFGPPTTVAYTVTHVCLVTVATGTAGLLIAYQATPATRTIPVGVSYQVTFRYKQQ